MAGILGIEDQLGNDALSGVEQNEITQAQLTMDNDANRRQNLEALGQLATSAGKSGAGAWNESKKLQQQNQDKNSLDDAEKMSQQDSPNDPATANYKGTDATSNGLTTKQYGQVFGNFLQNLMSGLGGTSGAAGAGAGGGAAGGAGGN